MEQKLNPTLNYHNLVKQMLKYSIDAISNHELDDDEFDFAIDLIKRGSYYLSHKKERAKKIDDKSVKSFSAPETCCECDKNLKDHKFTSSGTEGTY
jgi:hypothetical protein